MKLRLPLSLVTAIMSVFSISVYSQTLSAEDVYYNLNLPAGGNVADWKAASWLNDSGTAAPWVDSTADAGTRARFNITGEDAASLTIADAVTLYALSLNSGNLNITGGTLNFLKGGDIYVEGNSILGLSSTLTSDTGLITKKGKGTLTLTSESLNYGKNLNIDEGTVTATKGFTINDATVNVSGIFNVEAAVLNMEKGNAAKLNISEGGVVNVSENLRMNYNGLTTNSGVLNVKKQIFVSCASGSGTKKLDLKAGSQTNAGSLIVDYYAYIDVAGIVTIAGLTEVKSNSALNINEGGIYNTMHLRTSSSSAGTGPNMRKNSVNVKKGGILNVTGTANSQGYSKNSFILGQVGYSSTSFKLNIFCL